jgi:hypothetical protein
MSKDKVGYAGKIDVIGKTEAPLPKKIEARKGAMVVTGTDLRAGLSGGKRGK